MKTFLWYIISRFFKPEAKLLQEQAEKDIAWAQSQAEEENKKLNSEIEARQKSIKNLKKQQEQLQKELNSLTSKTNEFKEELFKLENDPRFELAEAGFYAPKYNFDTALEYESKLVDIRSQQQIKLQAKEACVCDANWTINGNKREGQKVTSKIIQLMLRAFNGESNNIIAKVKFGNVISYENQINKSFESINKLGAGFSCRLTSDYLYLKIVELHLVYEYNEKLYEEKEEQKAIREKMKEEERAAKEIEEAKRQAEQEEERYRRALEQAQEEIKNAAHNKQKELQDHIDSLELKLQEAIEKGQRAISMAQQTKRGHVYIISNIGSFGEDVFKIGMTRRLNPQDRVDELGGSSVPFRFDVHAMISSDDAPKLENTLHKMLQHARVNKVNKHKEFFKVSIEEIEKLVKENHGELQLTKLAEAREFRKSLQFKGQ